MDGKEQEEPWITVTRCRIPRSPSSYPSRQPAPPAAGTPGDKSSTQGTTGKHHTGLRAQSQSGTPRTPASGSSPAETRITGQTSEGLLPPGHRGPQGGPTLWGGEISDGAPCGRRSWSPPDPILDRNREDDSTRTSSPCLPPVDRVGSGDGHDHSHLGSHDRGASRDREGFRRHAVREPAMENLSSNPPYSGPADQSSPLVHNYGLTYNIASAGNVFTGINNGNVYMESVTVQSTNEFMRSLPELLKICFRADHKYHASGDEAALRRGQCTQGTRIDIIDGVLHWGTNVSPNSEIIYWLSGQAGAGKTTIAYTIACQLETLISSASGKAILGGSFFCSRQFLDTRSASSIVRTIVYHLALRSMSFRDALEAHGRFETVTHGPRSQLMGLLVEPWIRCQPERRVNDEPCYVLPIDALDELEGAGGVEFLSTLFDIVYKHDLSGLKFFITSRSEPALVKQIELFTNKQVCRLEEVPLDQSSADIKVYLDENLGQSATSQQIQQLVSDAAGLFIYAATVVEYLKGRAVEKQRNLLTRLLLTSPSSHQRPRNATTTLDGLYLQVLETCLVDPRDRGDPDILRDCLLILHTFLCTIERTSVMVAVAILHESNEECEIDNSSAEEVLRRLHAVLYVQDGLVMSFHRSFSDFLFDQDRSKGFHCNQDQLHCHLANGCFRIMAKHLRFNIANIPTSYQMDNDNPALPTCVNTNIPATLRYACRNWSAHLTLASLNVVDCLAECLHEFLQLRILFWMESMNLLGQRGRCQHMLRDAQRRFSKSKDTTELAGKLADAAAFAAYHSASKVALSTPHLYLSSLATFSRCSAIVQNWRRQFGGIPRFISAHSVGGEALVACITLRNQATALAVAPHTANVAIGSPDGQVRILDLSTGDEMRFLRGHTDTVCTLAYSPDGSHILSGSEDGSLRVWDVSTGEERMVLEGHTWSVQAVAYSLDGTHAVSGSFDKSVRVWNMSLGEEVRVLKGHSGCVTAVACSPDGTHVVSGSVDKSVRVWDVTTGQEKGLLEGHTHWVCTVAYSQDGSHVVSGSYDKSLRVWDVSTGEVARVLEGHINRVNAVACSPDGSHVVSGSADESLCVWDLSTGEARRVLEGSIGAVLAVAYLHDGTHIVSSSDDKSLRMWDVSTGAERRPLNIGHTGCVRAVGYSPDGTNIVSSSKNKSVCVLDVSSGEVVRVFNGHTGDVNAVAYSPDGSYIVSASEDRSLRVWNVSTGKQVWALRGHTGSVNAMAYSPDGSRIISGSDDQSLRVWDVSTGEEVTVLEGHEGSVKAVAYSPDGAHVVSGSMDRSLRVWDISTVTGQEVKVLKGHTSGVNAVAYSPDGTHVVSGSWDGSLQVWDVSTGEVRVVEGHAGPVMAVVYLPEGTHIVSGSMDESLRVWDISTSQEVKVLKGHTDTVCAVAYSLDGTHVVSGSDDQSVRIWNISPRHTPHYVRQQGSNREYTGWLVSPTDTSAYLMFVRPEALLPDDSNILTIPASAVPDLDLSSAMLGDRWAECYTPMT